jgi:PAS domain S-box-containing protein
MSVVERTETLRDLAGHDAARLLVENVRDHALLLISADGLIESWNAGATRLFGHEADEVLGLGLRSLGLEGDPAELLRSASTADLEVRLRRGGGERFLARLSATPVQDSAGRLLGYTSVFRDLSERNRAHEQLRESEARLDLLVSSIKDYAIFMLTPEGRVATWNAGAEAIKGYTAAEIVTSHIERFYTPEDRAAGLPRRLLAQAAAEGRVENEGWRVRKDGTRFWADVVITALREPSGELRGFGKVTRDLTDRRRTEEERLRLAQAQEAVRLRDEFLSIASHELKTPLTALLLQLEDLQDRIRALDPQLERKVERALRSGGRLTDLVETLLDVARIASGRFELRLGDVELGQMIEEVADRMRESAARQGCELIVHVESRPHVQGDRLRLEQVVVNLLSNAMKYGAGAPIELTARPVAGGAEIVVDDGGPGIAEDDRVRIFDRFERASSMRNYGGLGLGLYVSREILAAHGGTIQVARSERGGARLVAWIPLSSGGGGA